MRSVLPDKRAAAGCGSSRKARAVAVLQRLRHGERGSVTAEFAIVLPTVLLVLALVLGAIMLGGRQVALTAQAGEIARLEARGDTAQAGAVRARLSSSATVSQGTADGLLCVTLSDALGHGLLGGMRVTVHSCAAVAEGER